MAPLIIETKVYTLDPLRPDPDLIASAAGILRSGGLVAFPTETVYGLGANALDATAVQRIFEAKGRPATNPIIVHVGSEEAARQVAADWPQRAQRIADAFWPGPLTIVLRKAANVPEIVTAAQPTVAIRMPAHEVALALLRAAALPIAAPSANRSSSVSPTTAAHVLGSLRGRIEMVLDAGPTKFGIESTVLSLTGERPAILRPGSIDRERIEQVLAEKVDDRVLEVPQHTPAPSPGMQSRHYAPSARVECVTSDVPRRAASLMEAGTRVGVLTFSPNGLSGVSENHVLVHSMPAHADAYASRLYAALHELDDAGVDVILIESPPDGIPWRAVHDRLRRMTQ